MGFKLKSGNSALAFKNMGSSPAQQIIISPQDEDATVESVSQKAIRDPEPVKPKTGLTPEITNVRGRIKFDPHTDRILEPSLKPRIVDGKKLAPTPEDLKLANKYQKLTTKRDVTDAKLAEQISGRKEKKIQKFGVKVD